ncbi:RNA-guided endonuclease InsQ/TnpB family protein [Streptomyces subrutilus]|uniref:RNA-guided endonuclease InsQ/TnpB family protein n=1 Tax=Streptomyces subrutilus TaxID=36818 RepID=UPI0033C7C439
MELTDAQRAAAAQFSGACRFVWNIALEQRREYLRRGAWIGYREQAKQLAEAKREPGFGWLKEPPAHVLQQALIDLDKACRRHGTGAVRWRVQSRWRPSIRFPDGPRIRVERVSGKWARVLLLKLGWVRFRLARPLAGSIRSVTLSYDGRHWNASFLVDTPTREKTVSLERGRIGVDRGVVKAAVTSDADALTGEGFYDREFMTAGEAERYVRLQRRLSRARKGSKRRRRVVEAMAALCRRVRRRRADFNAQTAHRLVTGNALVVIEDLRTRAMTASARGDSQAPGRGVAAKAALNRAILTRAGTASNWPCEAPPAVAAP